MKAFFGGALCVLALLGVAHAGVPAIARGVLVDFSGHTLYTFEHDRPGESRCQGACAQEWPPFEAPADAKPYGRFTIVPRGDGTRQWAWHGKPLYRYAREDEADRVDYDRGTSWRVVRVLALMPEVE